VFAVSKMQILIGKACAFLGCIVNPVIFVISGGVPKAGDYLIEEIREDYKKYVFPPIRDTKIVSANQGNDAGIYGAAKLIIN